MPNIVVFGASGDLAKVKIMPALSKVIKNDEIKVYGYARSDLKNSYSDILKKSYKYKNNFPEKIIYIQGQYNDLSSLKEIITADTIIYICLPPHVYPTVIQELVKFEYQCICVEKPYGDNIEAFKKLQKLEKDINASLIKASDTKKIVKVQKTSLYRENESVNLMIKRLLEGEDLHFDISGDVFESINNSLDSVLTIITSNGEDLKKDLIINQINLIKSKNEFIQAQLNLLGPHKEPVHKDALLDILNHLKFTIENIIHSNSKLIFIDHYLVKPLMTELFRIQQTKPEIFNYLNNQNISSIEGYFFESILANGRSYFDATGMIKDVMQNHLTEMLASILCTKITLNYSSERVTFIKDMVIDESTGVYGQYKTYQNEMGKASNTETFAAFKGQINNKEWQGVPFIFAAGKGLSRKASEIVFNIKKESFKLFYGFIKSSTRITQLTKELIGDGSLNEKKLVGDGSLNEKETLLLEGRTNTVPKTEELIIRPSNQNESMELESYRKIINADFPIDGMQLIFNFAPESEIFLLLNSNGKFIKYKIFGTEDLNNVATGAYDGLFTALINKTFIPVISIDEAAELWRIFDKIILADKKLVYYEKGEEMPEKAKSLFK